MNPDDKRAHPRSPLAVAVDVSSSHNFYSGRTRDLSLGGLFIQAELAADVGALLTIEITLQSQRFRLPVEVVWTLVDRGGKVTGAGVRFLSLSAPARKAIEDFMKLREPVRFDMDHDDP